MYSIVIPVYNERDTIPALYERVKNVIDSFDAPAEVVIIEDGGTDGSFELLKEIHKRDPRFKVLSFSRNFGHQVAISAGLEHASGDAVMIIDGDLQDPPEVLPQFVAKWKEGFDVVYAIRTKRKENIFKRAAYAVFYRILNQLSYLDIPLDSGDFCLMDKRAVEALCKLPERKRFVRGLRTWVGFRQIGLAYERDKRFAGEPKYTFTRLLGLAYDGIFSISTTPLRVAVYIGFSLAALAFLGGLLVVYDKLVYGIALVGWSSTIVVITFLGGVILSTLGIIGEYVSRIYEEVKNRPLYVVKERLGL
ncbi:MAG TPA: glycosyltransferase [Bacteroidetes bacterium]|jgi:polyisoprenyl-phosphate glycosyltransferase|nr:glycosyltransferase [Bacteroidota bacterium]